MSVVCLVRSRILCDTFLIFLVVSANKRCSLFLLHLPDGPRSCAYYSDAVAFRHEQHSLGRKRRLTLSVLSLPSRRFARSKPRSYTEDAFSRS